MNEPTDWFTYVRRVAWVDTDPSGAYQFTAALKYAAEAEIALLREVGVLDELYPHLPRVAVRADFRRACVFDETVSVKIRVARCGTTSLSYEFRLEQTDGTLCAEGELVAAFVDASGRPTALPEIARTALTDIRFDRAGAPVASR